MPLAKEIDGVVCANAREPRADVGGAARDELYIHELTAATLRSGGQLLLLRPFFAAFAFAAIESPS